MAAPAESAEGYLFPATYELGLDSDPRDIVRRLVAEADKRWEILSARHLEQARALQGSLGEAGYYKGEVDGVYGPATVEAVEALQKAHGLPVTGTVDKATAAALQADLQAKGGAAAQTAVASTADMIVE